MSEKNHIPINDSLDWIVDTYPQIGEDGVTRDETFIFPPAKWSVSAFGPKQTGSIFKVEQRMIPVKKGIARLYFESYYDEEKEEMKNG